MSESNAAELAADTLGKDMLEGVLGIVQQFPGWSSLLQNQQDTHIDRLDKVIRKLVVDAMGILFKGDYPACSAQLLTVAFGASIKAKIEIQKTAHARHELADAAGQAVIIVMADPDQYFERMKEVRGSVDQKDMFHDSGEPLGHMGKEHPPAAPAAEGDGLEDVQPIEPPEVDLTIPAELPPLIDVIALLERCGLKLGRKFEWTSEQLRDAYVWGLAASKYLAEGKPTPPVPELLWPYATAEVREPVPPTAPPELIDLLKARGIHITPKTFKKWSQSQRIAAASWLEGRSSQRPDFLPLPKVPAPGQDGAP